ncbi:ABC transporter ATP-binding protein [Anaerococcus degeneri]|uniref:ABC transporter ATP-binding protein/permease n=1 Tax=Anaerococcus degeneri TaxID=361500 RepID=A0ABS7YVL5_9FIRM|nr:ABC transporter ATP-binding protein [Anaerococcus degeneri]MBP2016023.1 ABC-type multidrug transport system fused ATPase/permease subunit [Anaerococcus degeneri]MCA2095769.1 ABC transporter ATP-binding protein/permease [Anaerococcus degeneri]
MKEKYNKKDFKFIRLNWVFLGFIILSLVSNLEQYFLTRLIERFSRIVSYNDGTLIRSTIIFFILWAVIFFALRISRSRLKARISYLWNVRVKKELMENILTRDPVYFESKDKASYISLFNNDLKFIEENYLFSVDWIISNLVLLLVCLAYGFTINIEITMIIFVFGIIVMLISKFISSLSSNENEKYMKSLNSYNEILNDGFYGYKTLLSFNKTGHFLRKFGQRTKDNEKIHEKSLFLNSSRISVINISSMILQTFLMLLSALFVYWGKIEAFYFPVLLSLMNIIIWPMQEIADSYGNIISTRKIRERILKDFAFDEEEFPDKARIHKEIAGENSDIYFDKVKFSYGSKEILEKASFVIHNKDHVIISGASGTGKSTIFKLITKELRPNDGNIFITGKNIDNQSREEIYEKISIVAQKPMIFRDSILANIVLFEDESEIDFEKLNDSIKRSGLSPLIDNLKEGYNTIIKDAGSNLSGGEMQRIEIARALYKDSPIILIDEATSALDLKMAVDIEEIFANLDKTLVSISHRRDIDYSKYYGKIIEIKDKKTEEFSENKI